MCLLLVKVSNLQRLFSSVSVTLFGSSWHVANSAIVSSYRAFSKEKIAADLGVHVGLRHVNITLQGRLQSEYEKSVPECIVPIKETIL